MSGEKKENGHTGPILSAALLPDLRLLLLAGDAVLSGAPRTVVRDILQRVRRRNS